MSTVVVGDLHGRYEIAEHVLNTFDEDIIFMGDFLDSFDRSKKDQIRTMNLVLDAVDSSSGKVKSLMGNHERSYLYRDERCSGYTKSKHSFFQQNGLSRAAQLHPWIKQDGFLLSHAGLSQHLLEYLSTNVEEYLAAGDFLQNGYSRGGDSPIGGLYWCDWFKEFDPVHGVNQVVGHSGWRPHQLQGTGIQQKGNNWNVDCFEHKLQVLKIHNSEAEIINLEIL